MSLENPIRMETHFIASTEKLLMLVRLLAEEGKQFAVSPNPNTAGWSVTTPHRPAQLPDQPIPA